MGPIMEAMEAMDAGLEFWTLDEVAECLPLTDKALYAALWGMIPKDTPPKNEWPEPDSADRKAAALSKFWGQLTDEQRVDINAAFVKEYSKTIKGPK